MPDPKPMPINVSGYHAHVYYNTETKPTAERLAEAIGKKFAVKFGGFRDGPVGPHPIANLQIIFTTAEFQNVVPWLMLNRAGLGPGPSADRRLSRRSQHLCAVARDARSFAAQDAPSGLSAGAVTHC
jgi:hypothetical protein